jgi:hypothetical protein
LRDKAPRQILITGEQAVHHYFQSGVKNLALTIDESIAPIAPLFLPFIGCCRVREDKEARFPRASYE